MECVETLLNIESPTGGEVQIHNHIKSFLQKFYPDLVLHESGQSLIATRVLNPKLKHIVFVGHTDVVPEFFKAYKKDGKLYGSGASDMKGAVGVYLQLIQELQEKLFQKYNVSFVFYAKEEQTPMEENGLFELILKFPGFFKTVDLAIVGEPTDSEIHIGCVGSVHAKFQIQGVACHSARPWNGENAIYKSLTFLKNMSLLKPKKHSIFGVDFYDVLQVTELNAESGRTSLPGFVEGNVNFRFAPVYSTDEALEFFKKTLIELGLEKTDFNILDIAPAAEVKETELFKDCIQQLGKPVKAKQAWTDVAQLCRLGIAAFNFGPGLTAQAHQKNEYIVLEDLKNHYEDLKRFLL